MTDLDPVRRANVIGLGLIGGSVALALRERGWHVSGEDIDTATASAAVDRGVVDAIGLDDRAEITFVAVPVLTAADQVKRALAETSGAVTDVGSVKAAVCAAAAADTRFVGGHPGRGARITPDGDGSRCRTRREPSRRTRRRPDPRDRSGRRRYRGTAYLR